MKLHRYLSLIALALLLASCEKQTNLPQTSETATSGNFQLVADEVLKPVIDSLVQGYMSECPDAHVTVKYVSAGEAVKELMNHEARAIIIDRNLTPQERTIFAKDSVTIPEYLMAEDGIGCVTSTGDPLRLSALKAMIDGSAKVPSTVILPDYPSSFEYILDSLSGVAETRGRIMRYGRTDEIISRARTDQNVIGIAGSAWKHWLEAKGDTGVKFAPVIPHDLSSQGVSEPVMLHIGYIAEGVYPLTTMVNGYTSELANTVPRGFFVYCMTAHGQTVFKNFGILPKTQPIKLLRSSEK